MKNLPNTRVREEGLFPAEFDLNAWKNRRPQQSHGSSRFFFLLRFADKLYRFTRRFQFVRKCCVFTYRFSPRRRPRAPHTVSLFGELDATVAIEALRRDGYYPQITLPKRELNEILSYANNTRVHAGFGAERLAQLSYFPDRAREVENAIGQPVNISHYHQPEKACEAIDRILNDPKLAEIVEGYFGTHAPKHRVMMWWSHVTSMTRQERQSSYQTVNFHFDEFGSSSLYFSFYLTDVDENSGTHVLVKGTHTKKPMSMLLQTATQAEEVIAKTFESASIIELKGNAGSGFIEDPSLYHKANIPTERPRLFLQIRYYFGKDPL